MPKPTPKVPSIKVTVLGTGTSQGIPVIGCNCSTCMSEDTRDKRLRVSVLVEVGNTSIVIDVGPDFRQQMLRAKVSDVAAILLTHQHNDHIIGLDDVRPINFRQRRNMSIFARPSVQTDLRHRFAYVFDANPYPGAPRITLHDILPNTPFEVEGVLVTPIEALHGRLPVFGFRIGDFTYMTDTKYFEKSELEKINGSKVLILDALHHQEHHSHLNLSEALELIKMLEVEHVYLTHISHYMGKTADVEPTLPPKVHLAYDGLVLNI